MPNFFRANVIGEAGAGKSTLAAELAKEGLEIFRPSDVIRGFAQTRSIALSRRQDYVDLHRLMVAEDKYAMIRPLLDRDVCDLVIDGLRVLAHARLLERELDIHTIALDRPLAATDEEWAMTRYKRVLGSSHLRTYRDQATIGSLGDFRTDEKADRVYGNDFEPNIPNVMAMAMTRGVVIDASLPPHCVLEHANAYIAKER